MTSNKLESRDMPDTLDGYVFEPPADKITEPETRSSYPLEPSLQPRSRELLPEATNDESNELLTDHIESRVMRNPRDLFSHSQRVLMLHKSADQTNCFRAMVDLFEILGDGGRPLRANLIQQVSNLLSGEQLDFLRSHLDSRLESNEQIPDIGSSSLSGNISGTTRIVGRSGGPGRKKDLLESAYSCIDQQREQEACIYLEQALEKDPGRTDVAMELLALYRRNGMREAFLTCWTKLSSRKLALPELWEKLDHHFRDSRLQDKHQQNHTQHTQVPKQESPVSDYHLLEQYYLLPTSAGAFYAVSSPDPEPLRLLLLSLLKHSVTPRFGIDQLCEAIGADDEQQVLELLHQAQTLSWIQGFESPRNAPVANIGPEMEKLLAPLSSIHKGVLVDWNGFAFARHGIDDETADTLSALATDIAAVESRHAERLRKTLGVASQGWAAVDAYGSSRIGAWPMFVGNHRFLLVLQGEPRLNLDEFITLTWILVNRYGVEAD